VLVIVALAAATLVTVLSDDDGGAAAQETDATRTINVTGEGRVSLAPDTVYMTLGVDITDPDLGTAQTQAAERMFAIISALQAAGVAEEDIQTSNYSIYVERDYNQASQPITGYHVSHSVTAKVRDMEAAGSTLEAAVEAGANNVSNVWFGLDDQSAALQQARELAIENARAKAEELARLTDSTLGPVQTISETATGGTPPVPFAQASRASEDAAGAAPPINPGQTEVVLTVTVSYAIS
jgi:hypothetical protein